ncbi:MAG: M48 family metallopeptidase [Bacilli bacterium]
MNSMTINGYKAEIIYKQKKNKNISIKISEGKIFLTYPLNCPFKKALSFFEEHKDWIEKNYKPPKKSIFEKKRASIFGKEYVVLVDSMQKEKTLKKDGVIILNRPDENLIFDLFKYEFVKVFNEVKNKFQNKLKMEPFLKFRMMKTKWGTCNYKKYIITINKKLMYYEKKYLEYVMYHEFTHFLFPNHGKKFYEELYKYVQDYKKVINTLKERNQDA